MKRGLRLLAFQFRAETSLVSHIISLRLRQMDTIALITELERASERAASIFHEEPGRAVSLTNLTSASTHPT